MKVEEKVYAVLAAAPGVTTLAAAGRIKPPGDWQNLARPYIVHFPVAAESIQMHGSPGLATLKMWRYQVSCFADSYSGARSLAAAVRTAIGGYAEGGIVSHWMSDYDVPYAPDVRVIQIVSEFEIADML